jgi:hypothetical protein
MNLKHKRNVLLELLDSASLPVDFANFQTALAGEIIATERLRSENRQNRDLPVKLKKHLHLCHHLGDGLAWRLLDPHTIRQLAKNDGDPPYLSQQVAATTEGLEAINQLAKELNLPP